LGGVFVRLELHFQGQQSVRRGYEAVEEASQLLRIDAQSETAERLALNFHQNLSG
jgi:hypothetical protein